jgi:nucleoside phosphorylase
MAVLGLKLKSPYLNETYTVGWMSALPSELAAAKASLDETHGNPQRRHSCDKNIYTLGRIGGHNVVLAVLPSGEDGKVAAAVAAQQLLSTFTKIRFGLMVGIGGGAPKIPGQDIRLGDIVVSKPTGSHGGVVRYDYGKRYSKDDFRTKGMLNKPPTELLNAQAALMANHLHADNPIPQFLTETVVKVPSMAAAFVYQGAQNDHLFETNYIHVNGATCVACDVTRSVPRDVRPDNLPRIHYGQIASGDSLWKDSVARDEWRDNVGVMCFEMEAAGLMDNFPCLVIRGICDYADSHKNDLWQPYAAATAAAYAKNLLYVMDGGEVESISPAGS